MKNLRHKIEVDEDYIWECIRNEVSQLITDVVYDRCYVTIDDQIDILYENINR